MSSCCRAAQELRPHSLHTPQRWSRGGGWLAGWGAGRGLSAASRSPSEAERRMQSLQKQPRQPKPGWSFLEGAAGSLQVSVPPAASLESAAWAWGPAGLWADPPAPIQQGWLLLGAHTPRDGTAGSGCRASSLTSAVEDTQGHQGTCHQQQQQQQSPLQEASALLLRLASSLHHPHWALRLPHQQDSRRTGNCTAE